MRRLWDYVKITSYITFSIFSMTLDDKKIFPCDFGEVSWPEYRDCYVYKGITATLLGDRSDTETLRKNARKMKLIHYSFVVFCVWCAIVLFYLVLKKILLWGQCNNSWKYLWCYRMPSPCTLRVGSYINKAKKKWKKFNFMNIPVYRWCPSSTI